MGRTRDTSKIFTTVENIDVTEQLDERIFISSASPTLGNIDGRLWIDTTTASAPVLQTYGENTFKPPRLNRIKAIGGSVTTFNSYTIHTFTSSQNFTTYDPSLTVEYLVIGGGGGGASLFGGGGAGGYREGTVQISNGNYAIQVGSGGNGGLEPTTSDPNQFGNSGTSSIFNTITSAGGGGGGQNQVGSNGGSGGGGGDWAASGRVGGTGNTPSTSPSQGSNGGNGAASDSGGGGGGGANQNGFNGTTSGGGKGGDGKSSSISGTSTNYSGGGGGGSFIGVYPSATGGLGGLGGGGRGGVNSSDRNGRNGEINTGGGAGGGLRFNQWPTSGGNGGSGIVIIRYLT
jgi:hypothetical protein